jgi:glutamate dehydrogenase (NAD(P)+)
MHEVFDFTDELGPNKIIHIYHPPVKLKAVVAVDNKTKLIVSGATIPATAEAEQLLHERKALMIPDLIANAGGVIGAAVEYHGGTQTTAFQMLEDKIRTNTAAVLEETTRTHGLPRQAAVTLAERRGRAALSDRRW